MDKILIKDLLTRGIVGINDWEREKLQDILVNLEIDYDLKKLDKFYFDPKQAFSENYKKVESILDKFNKRIA